MPHRTAHIQIREAALSDLEVLFEWRNDQITRSSSHNTDPVQIGGHKQWLESILSNPNRKLYIAETKDQPVGTVRVDYDDDGAELSWTVAPSARGMGLGKRINHFLRCLHQSIGMAIRVRFLP